MLLVLMSPTGVIQTDDKWIRTVQFGDRVLTLQHPLSVDFIPEIIDIKNVIKEAFDEGMDSVHTRTHTHTISHSFKGNKRHRESLNDGRANLESICLDSAR